MGMMDGVNRMTSHDKSGRSEKAGSNVEYRWREEALIGGKSKAVREDIAGIRFVEENRHAQEDSLVVSRRIHLYAPDPKCMRTLYSYPSAKLFSGRGSNHECCPDGRSSHRNTEHNRCKHEPWL